jgi:hypothetical protein
LVIHYHRPTKKTQLFPSIAARAVVTTLSELSVQMTISHNLTIYTSSKIVGTGVFTPIAGPSRTWWKKNEVLRLRRKERMKNIFFHY